MKKLLRSLLLGLLAGLLAGMAGCGGDGSTGPVIPRVSWVAEDPIQCLGNPWEQDWLDRHGGDYAAYPRLPGPGISSDEIEIIQEFYAGLGITVFAVSTRINPGDTCAACSCAEGYTLFLLVNQDDVPTMLSLGYRREGPSWH